MFGALGNLSASVGNENASVDHWPPSACGN